MYAIKSTLKSTDDLPHIYSIDSSTFNSNGPGDLLFVYFRTAVFGNYTIIRNMLHPSHIYPWHELSQSQSQLRLKDRSTKVPVINGFSSKSNVIAVSRLQPPYNTKCFTYATINLRNSHHCFAKCFGKIKF